MKGFKSYIIGVGGFIFFATPNLTPILYILFIPQSADSLGCFFYILLETGVRKLYFVNLISQIRRSINVIFKKKMAK